MYKRITSKSTSAANTGTNGKTDKTVINQDTGQSEVTVLIELDMFNDTTVGNTF